MDPKPYLKVMQRIDDKASSIIHDYVLNITIIIPPSLTSHCTQYPPSERGDMLVFLSGMNEIASLMEEVKVYAQQTHRWIVLALHSALSIEEQDRVSLEGGREADSLYT